MDIRVILNGKKAGLEAVRNAIFQARERGDIEVRPTWEAGDVLRLVKEAAAEQCSRIVAAGGDGTVNEVTNALMTLPAEQRPELAILPLGTANDFACACKIPNDYFDALTLAQTGESQKIDVVKANNNYFVNVASGGFGAEVTANTPAALKNFLGGGAYTLSGLVQAIKFTPYSGKICLPDQEIKSHLLVGAVCNGPQAGGGQQLAPKAKINDGMLDILAINQFSAENINQVIGELTSDTTKGEFVVRVRSPWVEWASDQEMPVNIDGEPVCGKTFRFEIIPLALKLVVPKHCPLL